MEDVIPLLFSLNKISLLAFFVTVGFVAYQVYMLKKETKKKNIISVPDFNTNATIMPKVKIGKIVNEKSKAYHRSSLLPLIIGMIFLILFAAIFLVGLFRTDRVNKQSSSGIVPTPIVNFVASKGIKIYNQNWQEITDGAVSQMKPGESIFIGVDTINGIDIDSARIRVNKTTWDVGSITVQLNKQKNVFYTDYVIATGSAVLRIEAELHSKTDGWLGD